MRIEHNMNLANFNSYKISAICRIAYFPDTCEEIKDLFSQNIENDFIILGGGYNVILSKKYYDQAFIVLSGNTNKIECNGKSIICEAGCSMKDVSLFALENKLSGLEVFYDIPSTVGGAVVMNAGAGENDINRIVTKVWYYDPTIHKVKCITNQEIGYGYRSSFFIKNPSMIVIKAEFELTKDCYSDIQHRMETIKQSRWSKQPREYPNAGSVFKRPPGKFVGPMIEKLGLKGLRIGGAMVSEKHAGFIVNYDNAQGEDIIALIHHIQSLVYKNYDVKLEIEQQII